MINKNNREATEIWKEINWKSFLLVSSALWILMAIIFTLKYGIFQFSQGKPVLWNHIFFYNFNANFIWMLFTPILLWMLVKVLDSQPSIFSVLAILVPTVVAAAILHSALFLLLDHWLQNALDLWSLSISISEYFSEYFVEQVLDGIITSVVAMGLLFGYIQYHQNRRTQRQRTQLEAHLVRTRIDNVKHQLQPHFLFNSLQTISNLIHVDQKAADQAVAELSDMLRASLKQLNQDKILLQQEVQLARKYLDFQKIRFEEKITYTIRIEPTLFTYRVPVFIFQPLIENSIKHGFEATGKSMHIDISASKQAHRLIVTIGDNGSGFDSKSRKPGSTGIDNLMHRLKYLYPDNHQFSIDSTPRGTNIRIELPLEK